MEVRILVIISEKAPAPIGAYSQAVSSDKRTTIYISGQLPIDSSTSRMAGDDIRSQTRQSILNLKAILAQAGCSLENVVKTTVFLQDMDDFAAMNEIYNNFFPEPYPARSAVEVARLPKSARVEIEAIAVKD
jgi:2-iminobutanoate/2-iminopropanoate deaminase